MYQKLPRRRELSRGAVELAPIPLPIDAVHHDLLNGFVVGKSSTNAGCRNVAFPASVSISDSMSRISERWDAQLVLERNPKAPTVNIGRDDIAMVKMIIQRAGPIPLMINSDDRSGIQRFDSEPWRYLLSKSETWGSLSLRSSVYSEKAPLIAALARPAPELESLKVHNLYSGAPVEGAADIYETFVLPHKLFAEHAPSLRVVSLMNVYFPSSFSFKVWEQLTMLCVHQNVEKHQNVRSYSARWLEILSEMPRLENLNIGWKTKSSVETLPDFVPRSNFDSMSDVHLGHLRHLEFEAYNGYSMIALSILSKLVVQIDCNVDLFLKPDIKLLMLETVVRRLVKGWHSALAPVVTRWFNNPGAQVSRSVIGFEVAAPSIKNAVLKVAFEDDHSESRMRFYDLFAQIRALSYGLPTRTFKIPLS